MCVFLIFSLSIFSLSSFFLSLYFSNMVQYLTENEKERKREKSKIIVIGLLFFSLTIPFMNIYLGAVKMIMKKKRKK